MANAGDKLPQDQRQEIAVTEILKALHGLRFGCVTIVVQDGIVVQIDRTSKQRIDYSSADRVTEGEGI
jgi:hypothetical protein